MNGIIIGILGTAVVAGTAVAAMLILYAKYPRVVREKEFVEVERPGTPALIPSLPSGEVVVRVEGKAKGNGRVQVLRLKCGEEASIGHDTSNDVFVDDEYVSRKHAVISYDANRWSIKDNFSRNGLTVDGQDASKTSADLHDGSIVELGETKLRFYGISAAA